MMGWNAPLASPNLQVALPDRPRITTFILIFVQEAHPGHDAKCESGEHAVCRPVGRAHLAQASILEDVLKIAELVECKHEHHFAFPAAVPHLRQILVRRAANPLKPGHEQRFLSEFSSSTLGDAVRG